MSQAADGMTYAPKGRVQPVVGPGEFPVAAMRLDHGHIYGMCNGLVEAGAEIVAVHDPDPAKVAAFRERFPGARPVTSEAAILRTSASGWWRRRPCRPSAGRSVAASWTIRKITSPTRRPSRRWRNWKRPAR